ncbi:hypothetical protein M9434_003256 [Picochlorum sp. BPE23]|nr:hypothetical protein M9434_003256 [Picochlorum sp. BPE23]
MGNPHMPYTPDKIDEDGVGQLDMASQQVKIMDLPLSSLNTRATALYKENKLEDAIAIYTIMFEKAKKNNLTHPEMYICHGNCSAAYLKLEKYEEALWHAERSMLLAQSSLRRNFKGSSSYIKAFHRKGSALMGLGRYREAVGVFEKGLSMDAFNPDLKLGLEKANQAILKDLAEGKSQEHRTITYSHASQKISYHPYAAPLHRIKTDDLLPVKLLTPFQAENDHHIKDTYNYMTVQSDIRMPKRIIKQLQDPYFNRQYRRAIEQAVDYFESSDTDCRVLNLGAGAGVQAIHALRAGARHVTAVERWLYLALACKETMMENEIDEDLYSIVYKRPTDLRIKTDVEICCNLLIANIFDKEILSSGLIPAIQHSLSELMIPERHIIMPASATVYAQAVELRVNHVAGVDMSAANLYRWCPNQVPCGTVNKDCVKTLSDPIEAWYFDFGNPPTKSETKTLDVTFTQDGRLNAIMFWYEIHLYGDVYLNSLESESLQPGIQYLAGELSVAKDTIIPILATHNTVRMQFDIESADYISLTKRDASFPHEHFGMLRDESRIQRYQRAIDRTIKQVLEESGEAHVLDIGTGTGILAISAAQAGATSVVACDLHASLCDIARKTAAASGFSKKISVVHRDAALLQRGKEVRPLGTNVVIADMFDAGLLGNQFEYILSLTRRKVVQPGAKVIPQAATVYCMGIEAVTRPMEGVKLACFDRYRWDSSYEVVDARDFQYRAITDPVKVTEVFFDSEDRKNIREKLLKLQVKTSGLLNAVMFWFDLHLDDVDTISNNPFTEHGHYWGQAVQYLDRAVRLEEGRKVTMLARREGPSKLHFKLRQGVGYQVPKSPWKIEWGGGASVENPHFQRVHYCELLVRDFLMRCKSNRFPSIEKDITMVLAHCGSLFLNPETVQEAGQELVVLEKIHGGTEFSPGASLEAIVGKTKNFY